MKKNTGRGPSRLLTDGLPTLIYNNVKDGKEGSVEYVRIDTSSPMAWLADLYGRGITSLMVEGGACVLDGLLGAGMWDEARIETAATVLGGGIAAPATPRGRQWTKERVVEDADPYGGWETDRVPHNIPRDHPTPGRGLEERDKAGNRPTAGRRGRRPLQGGCAAITPAVIPRRAGVGPSPYEGPVETVRAGRRPRRGGRGALVCAGNQT